jgi:hypothetical protein
MVGNNNQFSTYNGPVAPNLTLTKIGTGALTLNKGAVVKDVSIVSGTNAVAPDAKVTGTISMARNAVLSIGANTNEICGLLGEYFDFSNTALRQYATSTSLVSLAAFDQTLLPFTPNTIAMSSVSNVFSFGYNGAFFQNKGDYRLVRWTGKFWPRRLATTGSTPSATTAARCSWRGSTWSPIPSPRASEPATRCASCRRSRSLRAGTTS